MKSESDRRTLRGCVKRIVEDLFNDSFSGMHLYVQLSNYSSSFATYIVSVHRDNNRKYKIFLKDFGSCSRPVEHMDDRRRRELHVYRNVLRDEALGTAQYYGSLWDDQQNRFWLFLEFVDGKPLKQLEFTHWLTAVRWLGRLYDYSIRHASFLDECPLLQRHDRQFFLGIAEAAEVAVSRFSPDWANRVGAILRSYPALVEVMVSQPRVLVHGSYRREHILLDRSSSTVRTLPVDWESAALGASLFDLAYLADGYTPPQLDEIILAYRDEAGRYGIHVPERDELVHLLDCYRLHRNMKWLSRAYVEEYSSEDVVRLVTRAERLANACS